MDAPHHPRAYQTTAPSALRGPSYDHRYPLPQGSVGFMDPPRGPSLAASNPPIPSTYGKSQSSAYTHPLPPNNLEYIPSMQPPGSRSTSEISSLKSRILDLESTIANLKSDLTDEDSHVKALRVKDRAQSAYQSAGVEAMQNSYTSQIRRLLNGNDDSDGGSICSNNR